MKRILTVLMALAITALTTYPASATLKYEFRGTWLRDCADGQTCQLDIDVKDKVTEITFTAKGGGETCSWSVNAVFDKGFDGPVAQDPYGNYYFYLTRKGADQIYASGTMPSLCGPQPTDQYFDRDMSNIDEERVPAVDEPAPGANRSNSFWVHNGSTMTIDPAAGTIVYDTPKTSIAGTVQPGDLLFKADRGWDPSDNKQTITGTAYVFKKGCAPAPYKVSGRHEGWSTLTLSGAAPVRQKNGCAVIDYRMNNNSRLLFSGIME